MWKKSASVFILIGFASIIVSLPNFADDYDVSGYSRDGRPVQGDISIDEDGGYGYIRDEDGNSIPVYVDETEYDGEFEARDDYGNLYRLETED